MLILTMKDVSLLVYEWDDSPGHLFTVQIPHDPILQPTRRVVVPLSGHEKHDVVQRITHACCHQVRLVRDDGSRKSDGECLDDFT